MKKIIVTLNRKHTDYLLVRLTNAVRIGNDETGRFGVDCLLTEKDIQALIDNFPNYEIVVNGRK